MADPGKAKKGPKPPPKPKHPCLRCRKAVTADTKSVQCQTCEYWVHVDCQGISNELFNILIDPDTYGGVCWNCDSCLASTARLERHLKSFETRVNQVEAATAKTSSDLKVVDEKVDNLRRDLETVKAKSRDTEEKMDDRYVTRDEYRERESRKTNIVLHRVMEPGPEVRTYEERKQQDLEECKKIFKMMDMDREAEEELKTCRRIGERGEDPRPMILVLRSEEARRKALDRAYKLRNTTYEEVGLVPDLTVQQRREEQQMVEEVERRNEEDLTEEDKAKNLKWLMVGPRGAKKIIKGTVREDQGSWRGRGTRGGTSRGAGRGWRGGRRSMARGGAVGQVTGANATPVRTTAATAAATSETTATTATTTATLLRAPALLPPRNPGNQDRTGQHKRQRDSGAQSAEAMVVEGEDEDEEEEEFLSPLRKK